MQAEGVTSNIFEIEESPIKDVDKINELAEKMLKRIEVLKAEQFVKSYFKEPEDIEE